MGLLNIAQNAAQPVFCENVDVTFTEELSSQSISTSFVIKKCPK
jgi:hypothetical protein